MKPDWKKLLGDAGAEFNDDGSIQSYGNPTRELCVVTTGDVLSDLSHYGLIAVHGEDAQEFLQNQFTNDLRGVTESLSQLNAYCSPKGRILAIFRIVMHADSYYLQLPRELVEPVMKRLQMFVLRSKVTLEDASDALVRFGFSGPHAARELEDALGSVPAEENAAVSVGQLTLVRIAGPQPRFMIFGALEEATRLWHKLNVRSAPVGAEAWHLLDVLAGIPEVYAATSEAFVPQMVNLQIVEGVSFRKGCYPGQEVVARMQYLGKLKRRMYLAHIDTAARPEPGSNLFSASVDSGQGAGKIVTSAAHPDGGFSVLAVAVIDAAENGKLQLTDTDGPILELQPLPYAFPADKQD